MRRGAFLIYFFIFLNLKFCKSDCPGVNKYNAKQARDRSNCVVWGSYHVKTFDDDGINFKSDCTFTLTSFKIGAYEFKVDVSRWNNACRDMKANCDLSIQITYDGVEYNLDQDEKMAARFTKDKKVVQLPLETQDLRVHQPGNGVKAEFIDIGVVIKWDTKNIIEIAIENAKGYRPLGLCGNMDQCSTNDRMLINGLITNDLGKFLEDWQVDKPSCPTPIHTKSPCQNKFKTDLAIRGCKTLETEGFAEARKVLNPDLFFESCLWDYCSCRVEKTVNCLCDTYDAYAKASVSAGAEGSKWRNDQLCPFKCQPGFRYSPCPPKGGVKTCGAREETQIANEECEEGCYCLPLHYAFHGKCYLKKRCPCTYNGKTVEPGGTVTQDCHTCTCTDGIIQCPTEPPCFVTAVVTGDPHYTTWDGKRYDFMGKCTYYLIKGNDFSIEADHEVYQGGKFVKSDANLPSYTRKITIRMSGEVIELKPGPEAVVNNVVLNRYPHRAGPIVITKPAASSILVALPNGIQIQWDGYSTGIFRLPTTMEGQVFGLLGTYTGDQSDDFVTPDGDIVNDPITFGNSWKTEYSCKDEIPGAVQHPCDINPAARPIAEEICRVIKSDLFKNCDIEDPETVYENCVYDTCFCKDNPDKCSCDQIAAAAIKCGTKGVVVNWREKISQCRLPCPAGQVYQECGDICSRSCEDLSMRPNCAKSCVDGCNCAPGTTMDEEGRCIPVQQCKCRIDDIVYQPGFRYVHSEQNKILTCKDARWVASTPTEEEKNTIPDMASLNGRCDPENHSVYTPCKHPTVKMCQNMHSYPIVSVENCEEGCECQQDYVFNLKAKRCVRPEECPCYERGRSYQKGEVTVQDGCNRCVCSEDGTWNCKESDCDELCIEGEVRQEDCNVCNCVDALWKCTNRDCSQTCASEGETKTIECNTCKCSEGFWHCTEKKCGRECNENDKKYEGCKSCSCVDGAWRCNEDNCLQISCDVENEVKVLDFGKCVCTRGKWSCTKAQCDLWGDTHIKTFDGLRYDFQGECSYILAEGRIADNTFSLRFETEKCSHSGATCLAVVSLQVLVGGIREQLTLTKNAKLPETNELRKITLTDHFLFLVVDVAETGLRLFWDKKTWIYLKIDEKWQKNVQGLCGNYNRIKQDDAETYDRRSAETDDVLPFVDLWRTNGECELAKPSGSTCDQTRRDWAVKQCSALLDSVFALCHPIVPVDNYYQACVTDSCKCDLGGDCECLCTAISAYAQQCNVYGVPIEWRSPILCPMQCAGNTQYRPCMSTCPEKTCEALRKNVTYDGCDSEGDGCVEGCGPSPAPTGFVYANDRYDKMVEEEICFKQMCGSFYDGDVMLKEECRMCVCRDGIQRCVDFPCSDSKIMTTRNSKIPSATTEGTTQGSQGDSSKAPSERPLTLSTRYYPDSSTQPGSTKLVTSTESSTYVTTKTTTAPCDKSKCPSLKCQKGFTSEVLIDGQCCPSCQHETKCVVNLQYSSRRVLKKPGQLWTDGPCKECTCVGEESYNHCTQCRRKVCTNVKGRNVTLGNTYYEFSRGSCCANMEPVACVHNNKLYRVGELWDVDRCTSMRCVKHAATNLTTTVEITEICDENCPIGFVYKRAKSACCGECVRDGCTVRNKIAKAGEKWYSEDECTVFTCEAVKGHYRVLSRKTVCPPVQQCAGNKRKGRCCEYCDTSELFTWKNEAVDCGDSEVPPAV